MKDKKSIRLRVKQCGDLNGVQRYLQQSKATNERARELFKQLGIKMPPRRPSKISEEK